MHELVEQVRAFGTWDAPITDDAEWIDVPTDLACTSCREPFVPGDSGAIMPTGFAQHRECSLRSVLGGIGHHVNHAGYCKGELGPDAGLSYRQSAILVWRMMVDRLMVLEAELADMRARAAAVPSKPAVVAGGQGAGASSTPPMRSRPKL